MKGLLLLAALALAGCGVSEAEILARNYTEATDKYGREPDCADEQAIANAYARERNEKQYREWKLRADITCL